MAIGMGDDFRTYARAAAMAGLQAVITAAWLAAGELPAGRRRLVRVGIATTITVVSATVNERDGASVPGEAGRPERRTDGRRLPAVGRTAALRLPVVLLVGSPRIQRRWLARLTGSGHTHPHRSLAVRMAALSFVGSLPAEVVEVREARRRSGGTSGIGAASTYDTRT